MRLINEIQGNFTVIPNYILQQKNISLKAIGLYCKLSSLPNDWRFSEEGLYYILKDGKDSIKTALKELEELGLFYRFQSRKLDGTVGEIIFYVSPIPMTQERKDEIVSRFRPIEIVKTAETLENTTFQPQSGKPLADNPSAENPQQYNINKYNINNIEEKINKKENEDVYKNEFNELWKAYPGSKTNKQKCYEKYIKYRTKEKIEFEEIKKGLHRYIKYCKQTSWYSPKNSSTWFNNKSWQDELDLKGEQVYAETKQISAEQEDVMRRLLN